jgi:hypothetical protein
MDFNFTLICPGNLNFINQWGLIKKSVVQGMKLSTEKCAWMNVTMLTDMLGNIAV